MALFAEAAGVQLLVPHMGVGLGSEFLKSKRWGRGRVATETCPHYLALDKDTDRGVQGKVNPPLRSRRHVEALWERLDRVRVTAHWNQRRARTWWEMHEPELIAPA